jgi:hypothetical protein
MNHSGLLCKAAAESAHKFEKATTAVVSELFENRS